jgi:hypothetical protein
MGFLTIISGVGLLMSPVNAKIVQHFLKESLPSKKSGTPGMSSITVNVICE